MSFDEPDRDSALWREMFRFLTDIAVASNQIGYIPFKIRVAAIDAAWFAAKTKEQLKAKT